MEPDYNFLASAKYAVLLNYIGTHGRDIAKAFFRFVSTQYGISKTEAERMINLFVSHKKVKIFTFCGGINVKRVAG